MKDKKNSVVKSGKNSQWDNLVVRCVSCVACRVFVSATNRPCDARRDTPKVYPWHIFLQDFTTLLLSFTVLHTFAVSIRATRIHTLSRGTWLGWPWKQVQQRRVLWSASPATLKLNLQEHILMRKLCSRVRLTPSSVTISLDPKGKGSAASSRHTRS